MSGNGLWTAGSAGLCGARLFGMRRLLTLLPIVIVLAGCGRSPEPEKPAGRPAPAPLLELARSPEIELDATDAPKAPRGWNRVDVLALANALVDAVERTGTADPDRVPTVLDATDHTFAGLDMRSRRGIADSLEQASQDYRDMPVDWVVADRFERGHRPVSTRIIKASWRTESDHGHLGVTLETVQAYVDAHGHPMFLNRIFGLWNSDPSRAPATQTHLDLSAGVTGVDRCHLVRTGVLRPDTDVERLREGAENLREEVATDRVTVGTDSDFRAGCD